jgi:hypothetical protein
MPDPATEKRMEGKKLPINPESTINFTSPFRMIFRLAMAMGRKTRQPTVTLRVATSRGSKTSRPRLIRINELPQITEVMARRRTDCKR